MAVTIEKKLLSKDETGKEIFLFKLTNSSSMVVSLINYGAIIAGVEVADSNGKIADITLGFDSLDGWMKCNGPYFGAVIGRYANRIAKGKFTLNGEEYLLAVNNGPNHLHGGLKGFDKVVWEAEQVKGSDNAGVKFTYLSKDGEESYPGNCTARVCYRLTDDNELIIDYTAESDKKTVINLTNHTYWNLAGHDSGDVLGHCLKINSSRYTPSNENLIPTGEIVSVEGTALDFTTAKEIGDKIVQAGGYDHNYVLDKNSSGCEFAAKVTEPTNKRCMEVFTTQPGVQFYTANFLDGTVKGKKGCAYKKYGGFCLETQHWPDSPNHAEFPSTVLEPGQEYRQQTIFRFSLLKD